MVKIKGKVILCICFSICCVTNYQKYSSFKKILLFSQFGRSECCVGWAGFSARVLKQPNLRCLLDWDLVGVSGEFTSKLIQGFDGIHFLVAVSQCSHGSVG